MDLIEDNLHSLQLSWSENQTVATSQGEFYVLPLMVDNSKIESFELKNLEKTVLELDLTEIEILLLGLGDSIDPILWKEFQQSCYRQNCGFEWHPYQQSLETINVLIEEKRPFIAIVSQNALTSLKN